MTPLERQVVGRHVSASSSCYSKPFSYPGPAPRQPFILANSTLYLDDEPDLDLPASWEGLVRRYANLTGDTEAFQSRIFVIAYGANRTPANLVWKFSKLGITGAVLGIPGVIRNADVVASNVFYSGHFYGDLLFASPLVEGVEVECVVLAVSDDQFHALNRSEEVPLAGTEEALRERAGALLANFQVFSSLHDVPQLRALAYVSWSTAWCPPGCGGPFAFSQIKARGRLLKERTQQDLFAILCSRYFPEEDLKTVTRRFAELWRAVESHGVDGYSIGWYRSLVDKVRHEGLVGGAGSRTGVLDAAALGLLLSATEQWMPSRQFRVAQLN